MLSSDSYAKREGRLSGKGTMHVFKVSEAVSSALKRERSDSDVTDEERMVVDMQVVGSGGDCKEAKSNSLLG